MTAWKASSESTTLHARRAAGSLSTTTGSPGASGATAGSNAARPGAVLPRRRPRAEPPRSRQKALTRASPRPWRARERSDSTAAHARVLVLLQELLRGAISPIGRTRDFFPHGLRRGRGGRADRLSRNFLPGL